MAIATVNPQTKVKLYCCVYRTGGTVNFKWHRTFAETKEKALQSSQELDRAGYYNMVVDYNLSMSIGLPETYAPGDPIA